MAEKRLIDANAMRQDWLENGENECVYDTNAVLDSIDAQPTVDAVEVVRCRDCKHGHNHCDKQGLCTYCQISIHSYPVRKQQDDFCSDGERRTDV